MVTVDEQIHAARTIPDRPSAALPAASIGALLADGTRRHGPAPILTFYDDATGERTELGWATLENWVAKTANLLSEEFDVGRGDSVATVLGSSWTTAAITLACWRLGAAVVAADADGPLAEIRTLLSATRPPLVFVREDLVGDLDDLASAVDERIAVGTGLAGRLTTGVGGLLGYTEEVLAYGDECDAEDAQLGDVALLAWSASAGAPASLSHEAVLAAAAAVGDWGLGGGDRVLCTRPLQAVDGLVVGLLGVMAAGSSLVLVRQQPPDGLRKRITDERVTLGLARAPDLDAIDDDTVRPDGFRGFLAPTGAPDAVVRRLIAAGWPVAVGHGLAEACCVSSLVPADVDPETSRWLAAADAPTVGVATSRAEVAVFDGSLAPHGVRGQIRVRGPLLAHGYLTADDAGTRSPPPTPQLASRFGGGWFHTGDTGYSAVGPDGREYVFLSAAA